MNKAAEFLRTVTNKYRPQPKLTFPREPEAKDQTNCAECGQAVDTKVIPFIVRGDRSPMHYACYVDKYSR